MLNNYLTNNYAKMKSQRQDYILNLIKSDTNQKILIVGGAEGIFADKIIKISGVSKLYTIEIEAAFIEMLKANHKLIVQEGDLNVNFPYEDNFFDLIVADQVIEHLYDTDIFLQESKRVLRGGENDYYN